MSGHDTHLAPLTDNTGAVPADHPTLALALERIEHLDLVPLRNPFGDSHDEGDLVLDGLDDGVGGARGGDVDD
jgi:hypothetical protein